ncbi:hypothetical protein GCM10010106_10920 [Thermopolyspora flexuosa]|jgi:hypothetical protein|uniref:Uncharacterized protein n=1 Tax=Thermopolyspora flexuosa TaxID=103836 RepID=A0A543J0J6_9ACTN|nr:hypothetical protein [Thermopolyspora flexuosa]TQM76344.1 hypothetical protein FHX40_3078 [Thermopolyspora flexuosa]GGM66647.1 hypothetical protein GCM10010106_10920 [Thermopolyspora flexuosa]
MPRTDDIDRLVAAIAPDPGPGLTPSGRQLMEEITTTPVALSPAPARRRRRWLAVPVAAGLTAAALALGWVLPALPGLGSAPAAAALDIRRDGDHYVIRVLDMYADPETYERELRARGLDITLEVKPTSRGRAGSVFIVQDLDRLQAEGRVPADGRITTVDELPLGKEASPGDPVSPLRPPGSCQTPHGCPLGVRIPVDLTERARITIGREARPGEDYLIRPDVGSPGEPLHCVPYVNRTVAEVTRIARERGVEPTFAHAGTMHGPDRAPAGWYVHEGVMSGAKTAIFLIGPEPDPSPHPDSAFGCGES